MVQIKNAGRLPLQRVHKYSSPRRLWHWTNTFVISGLLLTVLVNSTITENSAIASLLAESIQKSDAVISDQSVKSAAQAMVDSFWFLLVYFG
ncbi:hypothetical protein SAMN05216524_104197 [Mucilaginibacter sp. OK098]|nr:hypothetical protein SAMN05216524_104197 [Mucilaginibacter sp. OK098]